MNAVPAKIEKAGVYDLPEEDYHADPCPAPSLSSSIIKVLLDKSPRHAWWRHPRLNPEFREETAEKFDIGSAAHALILGSHDRFAVIDADDWRTKEAKEKRQEAYAAARIPLLAEQWRDVTAMAAAAKAQLAVHEDAPDAFTHGKPEQTLVWREGALWCRCRLDWLPERGTVFYDYKSTGDSAEPDVFGRTIYRLGYDVQCAFYRRGIRTVLGVREPHFSFIAQETEPPHALSVHGLIPEALDLAERKIEHALKLWAWCLENDTWPGYSNRTCYQQPPVWAETQWLDREVRHGLARESGDAALFKTMLDWQAPLETEAT